MKQVLIIVGAVVVIGLIIGGVLMLNSKSGGDKANTNDAKTIEPLSETSDKATKLEIKDTVVGTGAEAVAGKNVTVNYVGTLTDGTKFDSSYDRNQPFSFVLGTGRVIKGWDQGVAGMKVGGKRHLVIPSDLGYGATGSGDKIPGGATLVFDVELLNVE